MQWYYGRGNGTSSTPGGAYVAWVMAGIQYAGPDLSVKTFRQGLFSVPAQGGAASGRAQQLPDRVRQDGGSALRRVPAPSGPTSRRSGGTPRLPDAYSQIFLSQAKGGEWYVDGAKRYKAGDWPTKPMTFFDKSTAIQVFPTSPTPPSQPNPCTGCPSSGAPGTPGAA